MENENYDPMEMVYLLRTWVEKSLSSLTTVPVAEARYREVLKAIGQLNNLRIPIPEDLRSEKEMLEDIISVSNDINKLKSLSKELSSLARQINHHLKGMQRPRTQTKDRASPTILRVTFSDDTVIFENKAVDTFVKSLRYIGLERVSELHTIISHGHPLVSTRKIDEPGRQGDKEINGYFINTYSSTEQKATHLRSIARALYLKIQVEVVDM